MIGSLLGRCVSRWRVTDHRSHMKPSEVRDDRHRGDQAVWNVGHGAALRCKRQA